MSSPSALHFVEQSSVLFTTGCESWQLYQCLLPALPWDGGPGIAIASAKQCPGVSEERKEKRNTEKGPSEGVGGEGETRWVYTTKLDKSQQ